MAPDNRTLTPEKREALPGVLLGMAPDNRTLTPEKREALPEVLLGMAPDNRTLTPEKGEALPEKNRRRSLTRGGAGLERSKKIN